MWFSSAQVGFGTGELGEYKTENKDYSAYAELINKGKASVCLWKLCLEPRSGTHLYVLSQNSNVSK